MRYTVTYKLKVSYRRRVCNCRLISQPYNKESKHVTEIPSYQHSYSWLRWSVGLRHHTGSLIRNSYGRHVAVFILQTHPLNRSCTFRKVLLTYMRLRNPELRDGSVNTASRVRASTILLTTGKHLNCAGWLPVVIRKILRKTVHVFQNLKRVQACTEHYDVINLRFYILGRKIR
jgi:hypothetical protein